MFTSDPPFFPRHPHVGTHVSNTDSLPRVPTFSDSTLRKRSSSGQGPLPGIPEQDVPWGPDPHVQAVDHFSELHWQIAVSGTGTVTEVSQHSLRSPARTTISQAIPLPSTVPALPITLQPHEMNFDVTNTPSTSLPDFDGTENFQFLYRPKTLFTYKGGAFSSIPDRPTSNSPILNTPISASADGSHRSSLICPSSIDLQTNHDREEIPTFLTCSQGHLFQACSDRPRPRHNAIQVHPRASAVQAFPTFATPYLDSDVSELGAASPEKGAVSTPGSRISEPSTQSVHDYDSPLPSANETTSTTNASDSIPPSPLQNRHKRRRRNEIEYTCRQKLRDVELLHQKFALDAHAYIPHLGQHIPTTKGSALQFNLKVLSDVYPLFQQILNIMLRIPLRATDQERLDAFLQVEEIGRRYRIATQDGLGCSQDVGAAAIERMISALKTQN
ncbi:hypothetical protein SISNIDRAFT_466664 [Sistotremastrum niveocremeum HHB9708]|uniref:Uncharacterized protein n=1 Tax=Sistotremastrum niveocremeum HHB9708 TaxID=1314777 RepID=A0A164U036_9AGAM|nr:hypothetical protein SISNIDRAFT_466664 [Sistotremastrum niveocremeum HHB9708]